MKVIENLYTDSIYPMTRAYVEPKQNPYYKGNSILNEAVKEQLYISNDNGKFKRFYIYNQGSISPIVNKSFESIQTAHEYIQKSFKNVRWTTKDCKND